MRYQLEEYLHRGVCRCLVIDGNTDRRIRVAIKLLVKIWWHYGHPQAFYGVCDAQYLFVYAIEAPETASCILVKIRQLLGTILSFFVANAGWPDHEGVL